MTDIRCLACGHVESVEGEAESWTCVACYASFLVSITISVGKNPVIIVRG